MYPYHCVPSSYIPNEYRQLLPSQTLNFPFGQQDLGVEWHEQEGSWSGLWRRRGNSNIFDARWTMPGTNATPITAVLTIYIFGNFVYVQRRNSSDGNNCDYTGTLSSDGRRVSGTFRCNQGGGTWTATIVRRERPRLGRVWYEQEDGWSGVWTRRGNSNIFDARWTMQGAQDITAVLTINISGNNVQVLRRNSSDGNNCTYTGTLAADGRTVTGTYTCTQGGGSWRATITF
ncbi:hypothetical protein BK126_27050 [Paenibacillus sp. FSL H7-0326]|uniref:hypothetical protein n=1 Tax=Paenibacillus sp. FSL H7-0326 TaxID=1921144 RepID=UPI00096D582C|nr:hypothetical protein [Paenibacillus sp. FSL H7-0326]OMC63468.1 hypothetical protein BK126_27050 [Paenibacillus sp. FSL H7-0326]